MKEINIKYFDKEINKLEYVGGNKSNWIDLRSAETVKLHKGEFHLIPLGVESIESRLPKMIGKTDIMKIYNCENGKALKMLKLMYQMEYGVKIGKEYYISQAEHTAFIRDMKGKEVIL